MSKLTAEAFEQRKKEFIFLNTQRISDARTLCYNHCGELESFNPRQLPTRIGAYHETQFSPEDVVLYDAYQDAGDVLKTWVKADG